MVFFFFFYLFISQFPSSRFSPSPLFATRQLNTNSHAGKTTRFVPAPVTVGLRVFPPLPGVAGFPARHWEESDRSEICSSGKQRPSICLCDVFLFFFSLRRSSFLSLQLFLSYLLYLSVFFFFILNFFPPWHLDGDCACPSNEYRPTLTVYGEISI